MKNIKIVDTTDIQEDMRVNMHNSTVGIGGTPLCEVFDSYIEEFGVRNIHFICSLVYNLGMMHGKREERARRKRAEQTCKINKAGTSGEAERLRKNIYEMVSRIKSERRLRRIYNIVHVNILDNGLEVLNERQN